MENLQEHCNKINKFLQDDFGFIGASPANRFGSYVVAIHCIDKENLNRIDEILHQNNLSKDTYLASPLWGIGGLLTKYSEEVFRRSSLLEYNVQGTKYYEENQKFIQTIITEEEAVWESWGKEEREKFIKEYLLNHWEQFKDYGKSVTKYLK